MNLCENFPAHLVMPTCVFARYMCVCVCCCLYACFFLSVFVSVRVFVSASMGVNDHIQLHRSWHVWSMNVRWESPITLASFPRPWITGDSPVCAPPIISFTDHWEVARLVRVCCALASLSASIASIKVMSGKDER